jgi:hypothetical protein
VAQPAYFMNWCLETAKMGVPRAAQALAPRAGQLVPRYRGIGPEAYLNSTSQGEPVLSVVEGTPEDARKDTHIRGRSHAGA